ncbi:MAG: cell envelope integrity protein TolA [Gammaproteobacteria bacterium]
MDSLKKFSRPLTFSVILHIALLFLLIFSFASRQSMVKPKPVPEIIQATVLDESKIQGEVEKLQREENEQKIAEEKRQKELEAKRIREEKKIKELQQKRAVEEKKAKEEEARRKKAAEQEKKKLEEIKKQKEKEAERLAAIKKQKEAEEKKRLEEQRKKEAEEKKRLEEQRKKAAEERRIKEAEAKRKQEEARRKAEAERAAEEAKRRAEWEARAKASIANAMDLIQRKVNRSWIRPASIGSGLSCTIRVKLIPGGDVMDATVIKGSGNDIFDRSAENAVRKASPLPVPSDPELFPYFRTFTFIFKPQ